MKVTSIIVIVSSLSSFYYCNAESAPNPNKNRVVHQNNNEEAYTLYPDLYEERTSRRQLQDNEECDLGTIVDVLVGNGSFGTLVAAVTAADLVETLSGDGPFTVFGK